LSTWASRRRWRRTCAPDAPSSRRACDPCGELAPRLVAAPGGGARTARPRCHPHAPLSQRCSRIGSRR
jgi:hypothetical protein